MSNKLISLAQLHAAALETLGLIGEVASTTADAIEAVMPQARSVNLPVSGWAGTAAPYNQKAVVAEVLADETAQLVQIIPATNSMDAWEAAGVRCTAQGVGELVFTAKKKPDGNLKIFVVLQEVAG